MADRCPSFAGTMPGRFPPLRPGLPQSAAPDRRSAERPSREGELPHPTAGPAGMRRTLPPP